MKRRELLRELSRAKCILKRSGGAHDIWHNPHSGRSAPIPRHTEIANSLCRLIRTQLGIDPKN